MNRNLRDLYARWHAAEMEDVPPSWPPVELHRMLVATEGPGYECGICRNVYGETARYTVAVADESGTTVRALCTKCWILYRYHQKKETR